MVHRLRHWAAGDVIFGYDVVRPGGATGKTFTREHAESMYNAVEAAPVLGDTLGPETDVFGWVARIESTWSEGPGPDPGEPPLVYASLRDVVVLAYRTGRE